MSYIVKIVILLLLPFLLSCHRKSSLEQVLELAGKNRPELEKVLDHYKHEPLKLKAAKFLIENMDSYSFVTSPELDDYYKTMDSIFAINGNDDLTREQDSLLTQLNKPNSFSFKSIPDLQYVSADFLIDNIDRAFEAWKSPFAKDLSFDDFCEYLLPYKVGSTDRPDFWRETYKDTFYPYVKFALDTTCRLDSGLVLQYPTIQMDGESYRSLPDHIFDTISEFSVSCWINSSEQKPMARVFDLGKANNYVCFIPYTENGAGRFEISTDSPHFWDMAQTDSLATNQRSHIAITYSKNYITFYFNGILKKRIKTNLTNKDLISNYFGKSHYDNDTVRFKGVIDSFRIYNRELNYTEISALAGKKVLPELRQRLIEVVKVIRHLNNVNIILQSTIPGGCRPVQLINLKKSSCDDYTVLGTYIFRSLGIPSGIDCVPQWASRSLGHEWNVLYSGNRMEDYSFGAWWDTIGYHFKAREEEAAKIFRKTYAKQLDSPVMQYRRDEFLPQTFQNPCIRDITDSYLDCKDITVSLSRRPPQKREYAYLCNFNNQDWIPVHWGKINGKKAGFKKIGKNVAYLPVYYGQWGVSPAADPFILTKNGNIKKLIPDHSKMQTLILKRKYKPGNVPEKGKLLVGGRFQVSNKADFSDSLTVYTVNDIPEILYNSVNLNLKKPYRYFRFLSPPDSQGGQISEIEIYSADSGTKLSEKVIGNMHCDAGWEAANAFDGDPLTSYQCVWGEIGWVGMEFGKPVNITYFRYLPRNDDNFIKEGEEYELFYWENFQWNSLGKQVGTSKQYLEYTNAPINALFWLRNLTKGKEERIFTYENGKQVWW